MQIRPPRLVVYCCPACGEVVDNTHFCRQLGGSWVQLIRDVAHVRPLPGALTSTFNQDG